VWNVENSQNDKCQVGNMYPNILNLVYFFYHLIIQEIT
jgi:hypothetical protein